MDKKKIFTVKEVADILGYSTNSIYTFLDEKRIKGIRLGKGRFRISEEELNRVMHLSKKGLEASVTSTESTIQHQPQVDMVEQSPSIAHISGKKILNPGEEIYLPNLFDWFLAVVSILFGFSMMLFNKYFATDAFKPFVPWLTTLQITFIAAGIGMLITNMMRKIARRWNRSFHVILFLAYVIFGLISLSIGDVGGAILYSIIGLTVLISFVWENGNLFTFIFCIVAYALAIPIVLFISPNSLDLPIMIKEIIASAPFLVASLWTSTVILFACVMWWSYGKKRNLFFGIILIAGFVLLQMSFWFTSILAWGKATVVLLMGITCLLVPIWDSFNLYSKRDRIIVFTLYTLVLFIMLASLGVLFFMEKNIESYVRNDMKQRVQYAALTLDNNYEQSKDMFESVSRNAALATLMVEKGSSISEEDGIDYIKSLINGQSLFRTAGIMDTTGTYRVIYPPNPNALNVSYADRPYYQEVMRTKKTYVSDIFESRGANKKGPALIIATPILSKSNTVVGILVGSLDLDEINQIIQSIASPNTSGYFVVTDNYARRILHPNKTLIGKIDAELLKNARLNNQEPMLNQEYNDAGEISYQVIYRSADTGWIIANQAPIASILRNTKTVSLALFITTASFVFVSGFLLLFIRRRKNVQLQHE